MPSLADTAKHRCFKGGVGMKKSIGDIVSDVLIYAFMCFTLLITLYPFLNVLAISFNDSSDTVKNINFIIPRVFTLANYKELVKYENISHAFMISVLRTVIGTFTGIICSCMLAYTLSRKDFVLRRFIGRLFVVTMYVGGGLIPFYLLIISLKLNNTFWVYIIPALISTFNVIVIRSFMEGLPFELQESASLDGAGDFTIFMRIIMPLCLPVIATVSLFIAVGQWNSWFDTYIYNASRSELSTLQYELMKILDSTNAGNAAGRALIDPNASAAARSVSPLSVRMAVTIIVTVPILLVYPFIQRYFVTGLTLGAVKS